MGLGAGIGGGGHIGAGQRTVTAVLVLDESPDEKAGDHTAGASRQHNGRLGKVEISQVGVFLSLVTQRVNTWIDGKLFIPERWFGKAYAKRRKKVGIPETRAFHTKPELGWQMIQRAQANQVPFAAMGMDGADVRRHVAIKRRRGFTKHLRFTPDDPDRFVGVCKSIIKEMG